MADQNTFEETALPLMSVLRMYAFHLTHNSEKAKDLLQDTLFNAFRFWSQFQEGTNVKGWLCQIMRNISINRYRKEIKEPARICYEEHHLPCNVSQEMAFEDFRMQEKPYDEIFGDEIVGSIKSIKEDFRTAVLLYDVRGLNYDEIAEQTGCPVGTVRSRMHRGRKLLKKKLFSYAWRNGYVTQTQGSG
jgi:RNA polymerase sigma-70 factor, ECF subfamily